MGGCKAGLIGLAVMGQNLVLNMAGRGFKTAVFNRTEDTTRRFMAERAAGLPIEAGYSLKEFVGLLSRPRVAMLMVKAGAPVDEFIEKLVPLLEPGDLILDCGNSNFHDTERRFNELEAKGIRFMGVGVSGGEEGALKGPSIMPGGSRESYEVVRPVLQAISARTDCGECVTYIGPRGAGHFVKMVHNGVEYGDMQLISEIYDLMRHAGMSADEMAESFEGYNRCELSSYLVEITGRVLRTKDVRTGRPLVDVILDRAGQKGTGRWTTETALELGVSAPTISAAVDARSLSSDRPVRERTAAVYREDPPKLDRRDLAERAGRALFAARLSLYDQGVALMLRASESYGYGLNISELARIWKGGCIIRSGLLDIIQEAYHKEPELPSLLLDARAAAMMKERLPDFRKVCATAAEAGLAMPAGMSALSYFEWRRRTDLPTNLIQGQRDLFGAHTFERVDCPGSFHHVFEESE